MRAKSQFSQALPFRTSGGGVRTLRTMRRKVNALNIAIHSFDFRQKMIPAMPVQLATKSTLSTRLDTSKKSKKNPFFVKSAWKVAEVMICV